MKINNYIAKFFILFLFLNNNVWTMDNKNFEQKSKPVKRKRRSARACDNCKESHLGCKINKQPTTWETKGGICDRCKERCLRCTWGEDFVEKRKKRKHNSNNNNKSTSCSPPNTFGITIMKSSPFCQKDMNLSGPSIDNDNSIFSSIKTLLRPYWNWDLVNPNVIKITLNSIKIKSDEIYKILCQDTEEKERVESLKQNFECHTLGEIRKLALQGMKKPDVAIDSLNNIRKFIDPDFSIWCN